MLGLILMQKIKKLRFSENTAEGLLIQIFQCELICFFITQLFPYFMILV